MPAKPLSGRTSDDVLVALHDELARKGICTASAERFSSLMRSSCLREESRMIVILHEDDVARTYIGAYRVRCEENPALAHAFVLLVAPEDDEAIPVLVRRFKSTVACVSEAKPPA